MVLRSSNMASYGLENLHPKMEVYSWGNQSYTVIHPVTMIKFHWWLVGIQPMHGNFREILRLGLPHCTNNVCKTTMARTQYGHFFLWWTVGGNGSCKGTSTGKKRVLPFTMRGSAISRQIIASILWYCATSEFQKTTIYSGRFIIFRVGHRLIHKSIKTNDGIVGFNC